MKPELRTDELEEVFYRRKKVKFFFHRFFRNLQTQAIKKNLKSGFAEVASNLGVQPRDLLLRKRSPLKTVPPKVFPNEQ